MVTALVRAKDVSVFILSFFCFYCIVSHSCTSFCFFVFPLFLWRSRSYAFLQFLIVQLLPFLCFLSFFNFSTSLWCSPFLCILPFFLHFLHPFSFLHFSVVICCPQFLYILFLPAHPDSNFTLHHTKALSSPRTHHYPHHLVFNNGSIYCLTFFSHCVTLEDGTDRWCPETVVNNCQHTPHNIPEELRLQLHCGVGTSEKITCVDFYLV